MVRVVLSEEDLRQICAGEVVSCNDGQVEICMQDIGRDKIAEITVRARENWLLREPVVVINERQSTYLKGFRIMVEPGQVPAAWLSDIMQCRMTLEEIMYMKELTDPGQ